MPLTVLVVDDAPRIAETLHAFLSVLGPLQVVGNARNGTEGVAECRRLRPDLVIMDLNMPEMNGIEATRHIKAMPDPPRVILFTLDASGRTCSEALDAGVDSVCPKQDFQESLPECLETLFPGWQAGGTQDPAQGTDQD